jgi:hypothetical protein
MREKELRSVTLLSLLSAAFVVLLSISSVAAQDVDARVIVPDNPGGGGAYVAGCYRITQRLYGPYRMEFCLERRGSYTVTGNRTDCDGRLDWSVRGRDINIQLRRTSCGRGVAWSADTISCRSSGLLSGLLARVIVPDVPVLGTLRCTYKPSEPGYDTMQVTARRID